jgi:hypothetical protein
MWEDYAAPGGTFRENLYGTVGKPSLPDHHPGSKFKWKAPDPVATRSVFQMQEANDLTMEMKEMISGVMKEVAAAS